MCDRFGFAISNGGVCGAQDVSDCNVMATNIAAIVAANGDTCGPLNATGACTWLPRDNGGGCVLAVRSDGCTWVRSPDTAT